jgi:uncharacterized RDD family membrane protein YckC
VSDVRCPRCRRELPELTAFCVGCGAPLLLPDEAPQSPLDAPVNLDRRGPRPRDSDATVRGVVPPPATRADELAALERSHWELGDLATAVATEPAAVAEPSPRNVVIPPAPAPATATTSTSTTTTPTPTTTTTTSTEAPVDQALDDLPDAEVDALEVHVARAEPWRRAVAWALDGGPFLAAGGALAFVLLREAAAGRNLPLHGLEDLVEVVARERVIALSVAGAVALALATYATLAHALGGATLGKRLVGIRVVGPDGGPPSPSRSAVRSALAVASAALLGLGFVLALFTRTGRALHDLLARTWVVKAP